MNHLSFPEFLSRREAFDAAVAAQDDNRLPVLSWLIILGVIAALSGLISWWAIRRSPLER